MTARNVVPAVMMVRDSVWLTLRLTTSSSDSFFADRWFSRTRSKMTIVSLTEYPVIVSSAATTFSEMS